MASQISWFLTPTGRKFSFGLMTTASVVTFGVQYIPQTFLIQKYKEVVSLYESANPVPLSERMRIRWNEVLKDLSVPEHEVKYLEPFMVFGFDVFNAGSTESRWGAIIGIPVNFNYTDVRTIDTSPIRVGNRTVNWNRQDAQKLLETLVLSEDAQRYGIAREILMAQHNKPLIFSCISAFMVSSTYALCRGLNAKFQLLKRPLPIRIFFYLFGSFVTFGLWAMQTDLLNVMWEKDNDRYISQLDIRYSKGAVEFYKNILKRNKALRSLLGSEGESVFTPNGNEKHLFRQPRIPIDMRKQFFERKIAAIEREMESLNEDGNVLPEPA